ncbi:hypothetical protein HXX25_12070 [Hyphobacterium sp. CCMP332]|uniref:hypothetical protein n=1 Tax=Hyphobacterium sp. CCMP332 TaxID=2749086 RepID=UPI001650C8A4|nr:hypothetical protein [Hyphobacterium sp. CCMP332]QNL19998.1 hypothetical protein HXX25_12070 [Hyphobacterium sp. CCMP332]
MSDRRAMLKESETAYEQQLRRRVVRPIVAFLSASFVAGLVGSLSAIFLAIGEDAPGWLAIPSILFVARLIGFNIVLVAFFPTILLVFLMRWTHVPRGWGDTIISAGLGAGMMTALGGGPDMVSRIQVSLVTVFAAAGLIAGLTYWLAAGRPKPPYSANKA